MRRSFCFFAQLLAEIGHAAAAFLAVLPRRIAAAFDRAFVRETLFALEEELLPLAAALPALGIQISGHAYSSICAAFRRPATVVGHGRHVRDAADLETQRVQGANGGFPSGAGAFDAHLEILHAAFLGRAAGLLGPQPGRRTASISSSP